jgi:hypothetical protein
MTVAAIALAACVQRPELVDSKQMGLTEEMLQKVAILHFAGPDPESTAMISRLVGEALLSSDIDVVQAPEVEIALKEVPGDEDLPEILRLVAENFAATALVTGTVTRYRDRVGGGMGSQQPASLAFQMSVREVQGGRRVWSGSFDHTQHELSYRPMVASQLPGRGTRWVTGPELARFGVEQTVATLLAAP